MSPKQKVHIAVFYIYLLLDAEAARRIDVLPDEETPTEDPNGNVLSKQKINFPKDAAFSELESVSVAGGVLDQTEHKEFHPRAGFRAAVLQHQRKQQQPCEAFYAGFVEIEKDAAGLLATCQRAKRNGDFRCLDIDRPGHPSVKKIMFGMMQLSTSIPKLTTCRQRLEVSRVLVVMRNLESAYGSSPERDRASASATTVNFEPARNLLRNSLTRGSPASLDIIKAVASMMSTQGQTMATRIKGSSLGKNGWRKARAAVRATMNWQSMKDISGKIRQIELCYRNPVGGKHNCADVGDECFHFVTNGGAGSDNYRGIGNPPKLGFIIPTAQLVVNSGRGGALLAKPDTWGLCLPRDPTLASKTLQDAQRSMLAIKNLALATQSSQTSLVQLQDNQASSTSASEVWHWFNAPALLWSVCMQVIVFVLTMVFFAMRGVTAVLRLFGKIGRIARWLIMASFCLLAGIAYALALMVSALTIGFAIGAAWFFAADDSWAQRTWAMLTDPAGGRNSFLQVDGSLDAPLTDIGKQYYPSCFFCYHLPEECTAASWNSTLDTYNK